jgi:LacI family transcriptional regulator
MAEMEAGPGMELELTPSTPPPTGHATMATVAAYLGLSRATVTHVLNGRAGEQRIRPETQRRVLEAARDLGYRANASARAVRAGRFGNIALIQSLLGAYLPGGLLHGVTTATAEKGLHLVLTQVPGGVIDDESYLPHTMRELSVDGALINRHAGFPVPFLERIHRLRIPAVSLNVQQEFDCIHPDEVMGGRLATESLLRLGHERIAYVDTEVSEDPHFSKRDRRLGYEGVMASAGKRPRVHQIPQSWRAPGQPTTDGRVQAAQALLTGPDRPTAVVAYEIAEAMAVVHAAHLLRLHIPADLSIVVFHHWIDDRFFLPFHTVYNAMREVGTGGVGMLLEKIESPETPLPARVISVRLMDGATCLPPRP